MARMSIYVTDGMKERMSALDERVNWSEVAQKAFEREISISTLTEDPKMDQVITRLRQSKERFKETEAKSGREHGRNWAKAHASFKDLQAIANANFGGRDDLAVAFDELLGNTAHDPDECFWQGPDGLEFPTNEYVEAYVQGAKDIWAEVADKI